MVLRGIIDHDLLQAPLQQINEQEKEQVAAVLASQGLGRIPELSRV